VTRSSRPASTRNPAVRASAASRCRSERLMRVRSLSTLWARRAERSEPFRRSNQGREQRTGHQSPWGRQ
jgi:hypothetical protein